MDLFRLACRSLIAGQGAVPSVITFNFYISACGYGQLRLAQELFSAMPRWSLAPNVITYNAMIRVYAQNFCCRMGEQIYLEMQRQGVAPDLGTYNALIRAWGTIRPARALEVFESLEGRGLAPSVFTYNALLSVCEEDRLQTLALEVFHRMAQRGVEPNVITCSTLIRIFEKRGRRGRYFARFVVLLVRSIAVGQ